MSDRGAAAEPTRGRGLHGPRRAVLQQAMIAAGLDAILLTDEANIAYFAGYAPEHFFLTRSRMVALIVPAAGPALVTAPTSHLQDVREQTAGLEVRGYEGLRGAPVSAIAAALAESGARQVGAELGFELRVNMSIADFDALRGQTAARFRDCSALIWQLRLVKEDAELALIEEACRIGELAYERVLPGVRAGERERDIASRLASEVALAGGRVAFLIMASGPGSYHRANGAPGERVLCAGDFLFVDLGVRYAGYHGDFNRCLIVERDPTPAQVALQEGVRAVSEGAARYLVPGAAVREVYAQVLDDCRRAALPIHAPGRIGHGIGLGVTEPPHLSAEDPTLLAAGMVVTVEPAVERSEGLYCAECVYAVGDAGGRRLNPAPALLTGT